MTETENSPKAPFSMDEPLLAVFSDLDGTLIHYDEVNKKKEGIIQLPRSKTGSTGVISSTTLDLCRQIRRQGVRFCLVSGARTSTLFQRLAYLPIADAYVSENGGRIFYPSTSSLLPPSDNRKEPAATFEPVTGGLKVTLVEDDTWQHDLIVLQEYAQSLKERGLVLDTEGYRACFRVNRNQQMDPKLFVDFEREASEQQLPPGLVSTVNLGCVDVYPATSGKASACSYLAGLFADVPNVLSGHCVCLCDDDNDLQMAAACRHAFLPSIASDSMRAAVDRNRDHFTYSEHLKGTLATEALLACILTVSQTSRKS